MKTKLITMLIVAAFALTISATAQAGSFSSTGWNVPTVMHASDYDAGTVWRALDGTDPLPGIYNDPHNELLCVAPNGVDYGEDTWGIMSIDSIHEGFILTNHTAIKLTPSLPDLWSVGDDGMELWGIFYGHKDTQVIINPDGSQISYGSGIQFDIWAQPVGSFTGGPNGVHAPLGWGSADRLAQDKYAGVGYDAAGNIIGTTTTPGDTSDDAFLWMTMAGAPGFFSSQPAASFNGTYYPGGGGPQGVDDAGGAKLWGEFDDPGVGDVAGVDYGTANATYDLDWYHSGFTSDKADIRLQIDTEVNTAYSADFDWLVTSSDPLQTYAVPEPVTMLGVFMGISGLAGYVRKRRLA